MNRKEFTEIAISSLRKWQDNNATLRAAALAFFIILPLPSILLISADIYSQIYGHAQGIQQLIQQISVFAGSTIGNLVGQLLQDSSNSLNSVFNSVFIIIFAIAGAIGAFAVLQDTFNVLWNVKLPKHRSAQTKVKERFVPFVLVTVAAIIAGGWFEFTGLLSSAVSNTLGKTIGVFGASAVLFLIQVFFSFGSAILLFAVIFREIPDTLVEWGDVWLGAIIAAIAFVVLNNVFWFYLQNFPVTTLVGAAGSLIILLLWIFLMAQILLYGAQFSHCWAESVGSHAGKGENHQHPWKRWRAGGMPNGKTMPENIQNQIKDFRLEETKKKKR